MEETKQERNGITYRHLTDNNYFALKELERQYKRMSYKTWFELFDPCNSKWVLTVEVAI